MTKKSKNPCLTCEDCISRKAALNAIQKLNIPEDMCVFEIKSHIEVKLAILPPVTPQPKVGKWYIKSDCEGKTRILIHKECGFKSNPYVWKNYNFCPECGARMTESEE